MKRERFADEQVVAIIIHFGGSDDARQVVCQHDIRGSRSTAGNRSPERRDALRQGGSLCSRRKAPASRVSSPISHSNKSFHEKLSEEPSDARVATDNRATCPLNTCRA